MAGDTAFQFPDNLPSSNNEKDILGASWEAAGRRIAPMLGSYSAAVVTSSDELAAAYVALGIGLAEAEHRRVAIGDLVGEVAPIQSLVETDDPHGISDSFTFGVSLNRIAQPIDSTGNLYVMPSGTGSVLEQEIFSNTRWQRLANGFREVGALLILVAPADAPGLKQLIQQMDGVVLVGDQSLEAAPYAEILARVPKPDLPEPRRTLRAVGSQSRKGLIWQAVAGLVLVAAIIGGALALKNIEIPRRQTGEHNDIPQPTVVSPAETLVVPPPANLADSLNATGYSVEFSAYNTHESALLQLRPWMDELPAATISPVPVGTDRETYYKVIAGAFRTQDEADRFLERMRKVLYLTDHEGTVVRTPYALLLDSAPAGNSQILFEKYIQIPHPVYVLSQNDGSLRLYTGAFERPEDAAALLVSLREANFNPVVAYRTGRIP